MSGPPPQPAERKRLLGNPGKRALAEPQLILPAIAEIPEPPSQLAEVGSDAWRRLWGVGQAWLSPITDLAIITRLCEAYDEREQLRRDIAANGHYTTGSMGQPTLHPAVSALRQLEQLMTRYESLCGFTPADRSRIGMAEVQRVSRLDQLIAKRSTRPSDPT